MEQGYTHISGEETYRVLTLTIGIREYERKGRVEVHTDAEGCDAYGRNTDEALRNLFLELAGSQEFEIRL